MNTKNMQKNQIFFSNGAREYHSKKWIMQLEEIKLDPAGVNGGEKGSQHNILHESSIFVVTELIMWYGNDSGNESPHLKKFPNR